jgi:hypothetical protein
VKGVIDGGGRGDDDEGQAEVGKMIWSDWMLNWKGDYVG